MLAAVRPCDEGEPVTTRAALMAWLTKRAEERTEPFTFVVDLEGVLRVAPRRSEHVACAAGRPVLSAGEITFHDDHTVTEISNQSTGYCPAPASWPAVAAALDRAGLHHPGRFTVPIVFRHCPECGERNLVKDDHYVCALCDADLPETCPEGQEGWGAAGWS